MLTFYKKFLICTRWDIFLFCIHSWIMFGPFEFGTDIRSSDIKICWVFSYDEDDIIRARGEKSFEHNTEHRDRPCINYWKLNLLMTYQFEIVLYQYFPISATPDSDVQLPITDLFDSDILNFLLKWEIDDNSFTYHFYGESFGMFPLVILIHITL